MERASVGGRANWAGADFELRLGVEFCVYILVGQAAGLGPGAVRRVQLQAPEVVDDLILEFETGARWAIQAKGACLSPANPLCQKQPQMATPAALLQVAGNVIVSQHPGQVTQALPALGVVCIQDDEPGLALLVKRICAQGNLTPQVIKQVADVQLFMDADVAAVVKLAGVKIPTLDKSLGQHQGWPGEFGVWNRQAFRRCHRVTSIARWSSAQ